MEMEQIKRHLSGEESLTWKVQQKWEKAFAKIQLLYGTIEKTLGDGQRLCQASVEINRPIEFYW
jgi:hypothetical protein